MPEKKRKKFCFEKQTEFLGTENTNLIPRLPTWDALKN